MLTRFVKNYIERHRNGWNQLLHLIGLPVTFVVPIVLLVEHQWLWAGICFVFGYALQFLGHAIEGNDPGEVVLVKKWLGKPYLEFAPAHKDGSRESDAHDQNR